MDLLSWKPHKRSSTRLPFPPLTDEVLPGRAPSSTYIYLLSLLFSFGVFFSVCLLISRCASRGRKKDLIISGGVNVYPRDIEEVIVQHPNVVEAAVFGVPDEKWGEVPVAAVILKEKSASLTDEQELLTWINQHIEARYQRVSAVLVQDEFPRSTAGKTLKRVMRDVFWQERPDSI